LHFFRLFYPQSWMPLLLQWGIQFTSMFS
jgi:hypothetical protein